MHIIESLVSWVRQTRPALRWAIIIGVLLIAALLGMSTASKSSQSRYADSHTSRTETSDTYSAETSAGARDPEAENSDTPTGEQTDSKIYSSDNMQLEATPLDAFGKPLSP